MNKGFITTILMTATLVTAGHVQAQPHGAVSFDMLDQDKSGEITLDEMRMAREARFRAADADGNGVLSRDEMVTAARAEVETRVDRMIERFDADGDGAVSLAEMPRGERGDRGGRGPERMFDRADRDDSGGLSREEFDAARAHMRERQGGRKHSDD